MSREVRDLIFRMVAENPTWGAPRIHGELLKLGFDIAERTVSGWVKRAMQNPDPARLWLSFLRNHGDVIAAMDFFTVPTLTFGILYCFFVIDHDRRKVLHFNVTRNPTAFCVSRRINLSLDNRARISRGTGWSAASGFILLLSQILTKDKIWNFGIQVKCAFQCRESETNTKSRVIQAPGLPTFDQAIAYCQPENRADFGLQQASQRIQVTKLRNHLERTRRSLHGLPNLVNDCRRSIAQKSRAFANMRDSEWFKSH